MTDTIVDIMGWIFLFVAFGAYCYAMMQAAYSGMND